MKKLMKNLTKYFKKYYRPHLQKKFSPGRRDGNKQFRSFKCCFLFIFHVDPDLDIYSEKLTAKKNARSSLEIQIRFEVPADLQVNIIKIQRLLLV